jgi:YVTN family beta-propeller protein
MTRIAGGYEGFEDGESAKARFNQPCGLLCTRDGSKIYVADSGNNRIRCVHTATNQVTTVAGSGLKSRSDGPALKAACSTPHFLAFDASTAIPESVIYFSQRMVRLRRLSLATSTFYLLWGVLVLAVCGVELIR